ERGRRKRVRGLRNPGARRGDHHGRREKRAREAETARRALRRRDGPSRQEFPQGDDDPSRLRRCRAAHPGAVPREAQGRGGGGRSRRVLRRDVAGRAGRAHPRALQGVGGVRDHRLDDRSGSAEGDGADGEPRALNVRIWLVRHGETEWSKSGRHTGRTDIPLTPTGQQQGGALGRHLAGRQFALVLTSPLERARETCRLAGFDAAAQVSDDLLEWNYGIYEGRTTAAVRAEQPGWSIWTTPIPQGETVEQVGERARRVIERADAVA